MPMSWREVNGGPNNWTLAGRRDTPPTGAGDAVGAIVQFGSDLINQYSMTDAIRRGLATLEEDAHRLLSRSHGSQGAFAIVSFEVIQHPGGMASNYYRGVALESRTYPDPQAAMQNRGQRAAAFGTVRAGGPTASVSTANRYFGGEYVEVPEPSRAQRYGPWTAG